MTKANHTKKPWEEREGMVISIDPDTLDNIICAAPNELLESYENWAANAALIAAAPDLLEAAIAMEESLPSMKADGSARTVDPGSPRGKLRAAIEKATGQKP